MDGWCGVQSVFRGPRQAQLLKRTARNSVRTTPTVDHVHLQVCDLLVAILMVKSSMNKRTIPQAVDMLDLALNNPVVSSNTRKKVKTLPSENPSGLTHWSSWVNKGSGGQIAQLQNIEHMQTQTNARDTPLNVTTTNESLNPLAPLSDKWPPKGRVYPSKGSIGEKACLIFVVPSSGSLTTQIPSSETPACTPPASALDMAFISPPPPLTLQLLVLPYLVMATLHFLPLEVTLQPLCLLEVALQFLALQIVQQAYNSQTCPLTRTYSVLDIGAVSQPQDVSVLAPLPYDYDTYEGVDMGHGDDHDNFPSQSSDEDERAAEAALYTSGAHTLFIKFLTNNAPQSKALYLQVHRFSLSDSLLMKLSENHYQSQDEQDSQALDAMCPADSQIDPILLADSEQHYSEESDVVCGYHQRNGFLHAPAPERLHVIHDQQQPSAMTTVSMPTQNIPSSVAQGSQLSSEPAGSRTMPQTAADGELMGHPTKLCSYPNKFHKVIERAKLIMQCDSAMKNPFPPCSMFLDTLSVEIFNKVLVKCMDTPAGYWPNYCSQLGILLWESLMTWWSTIKAKALNQSQSLALIKGAAFLRDVVDNEGSMNNMAHPALVTLVMDFFYMPSSVGSAFPEVFSREVPRVTMCLVATALRAALDKYTQTGI
ncbi:hypothetical protein BKA83DRAFT_4501089 [Pisolithus microcarpus]|nr:hypothetical protein BKA83DRAFT_4501089 [Pisolithus microcarpus]